MPRKYTQPRNELFMERFKHALAQQGKSMAWAARELGVSRQRLYTLLHWFPGVSDANTKRLADLVGVSAGDLVAWAKAE